MMQAQREINVCYICNRPIRNGQVMALVIIKGKEPPMMAHLYCYTLQQKRRQQQERERESLPS